MSDSEEFIPDDTDRETQSENSDSEEKIPQKTGAKKRRTDFEYLFASSNTPTNDLQYFNANYNEAQRKSIIQQLKYIKSQITIEKPLHIALLERDIPLHFKCIGYKRIMQLKSMSPYDSEYSKLDTWINSFMQIPFGKYKNFSISLHKDGITKSRDFIKKSKNILDSAVYGLENIKQQIINLLGKLIVNPNAIGSSIAIKGPMGTGKTTIVKNGISKILGRDFAYIALGGASDGSFLEGHSYTYQGSTYGKIIDILIQCKSMNPIIYFDELDKVSESSKGEEIIGILTHLTDTTQNNKFHDKYFSEIDFDLSKALFIFSYNDEYKVNKILKDRMYCLETNGYNIKDKIIISKHNLIPNIVQDICLYNVTIHNSIIKYIIENYVEKEEGVRNLKRALETVYTKLNMVRLLQSTNDTFSYVLTKADVDKFLEKKRISTYNHMYL